MLFGKKKSQGKDLNNFLSFMRVEKDASGMTLQADIKDEDLKKWLYLVTHSIQAGFTQKGIQNYLMGQFVIGGQLIEFAFVKEGREGPHAQLLKVKAENDRLQKEISKLKEELKIVEQKSSVNPTY